MRYVLMLLVACAFGATAKDSKFYKWTDENGVTHYTQTPPPEDVEADELVVKERRASQAEPEPEPAKPQSSQSNLTDETAQQLAADADALAQQAEAFKQRREQARKYNCERGKMLVAALEPSQRTVINEDGKQTVYTGDERVAKLNEARQMVTENCNG